MGLLSYLSSDPIFNTGCLRRTTAGPSWKKRVTDFENEDTLYNSLGMEPRTGGAYSKWYTGKLALQKTNEQKKQSCFVALASFYGRNTPNPSYSCFNNWLAKF